MTTESIPGTSRGYVLQPDQGRTIESLGVRMVADNVLTGNTLFGGVCTNPGPGGPPLHLHQDHDEFYYVLRGRYRFKIGEEEQEGGPGTFAFVPRGSAHTFASVGPEEGQILAFSLPGLEQFLEGMAALSARGVDQREMDQHYRDFGSEIVGPPLV